MLGPKPSIFIASRDAKWIICSFSMARQCLLVQRTAASPSRRTAGESHTGQRFGMVKGTSEPVRFSGTTRITSGIISAAL